MRWLVLPHDGWRHRAAGPGDARGNGHQPPQRGWTGAQPRSALPGLTKPAGTHHRTCGRCLGYLLYPRD